MPYVGLLGKSQAQGSEMNGLPGMLIQDFRYMKQNIPLTLATSWPL